MRAPLPWGFIQPFLPLRVLRGTEHLPVLEFPSLRGMLKVGRRTSKSKVMDCTGVVFGAWKKQGAEMCSVSRLESGRLYAGGVELRARFRGAQRLGLAGGTGQGERSECRASVGPIKVPQTSVGVVAKPVPRLQLCIKANISATAL